MVLDRVQKHHQELVKTLSRKVQTEYPIILQNICCLNKNKVIGEIDLMAFTGFFWDLYEVKVNNTKYNQCIAAGQLYSANDILQPLKIRDCYYVSREPETKRELIIQKIDFNQIPQTYLKHNLQHADISEFLKLEKQY